MEGEQQGSDAGVAQVAPARTSDFKKVIPSLISWVVTAFAFLVPIFAVPSAAVSLDVSKAWLLLATVFVAGILSLVYLLLRGELSLPKTLSVYALVGVVLATLLSTLFSPQKVVSFLGSGLQVGTFSTILLVTLLAFFGMQSFRDRAPLVRFFLALFGGFTLLSVFHLLRLTLGASMFSFGVFTSPVFSLVGKWNDFAVFSGLILVLSMVAEYYFRSNARVLWASRAFALISAFFLVMIDFWILWVVIAVLGAVFLLRTIVQKKGSEDGAQKKLSFSFAKVSYLALIILLLGACFGYLFRFSMGDSILSQRIVEKLSPQAYAEIVLPPSLSFGIAKDTWKEGTRAALLGTGPNRFSTSYFMHKPEGINNTPLWDSSFDSAFSHVTTFFATTGIVGTIAWLFLLLSVLLASYRVLRDETEGLRAYIGHSAVFGTLYLFAVLTIYLPNLAMVSLAFLFLGALLAVRAGEEQSSSFQLALPSTKGWGVAMVPLLVLLLIGLSGWSFIVSNTLRAETAYQEARISANQGNIRDAFTEVEQAEKLSARDSHYRLVTDLHLLELQRVLGEAPSSPEALQNKVRELAQSASNAAQKAIDFDPTNYLNYVSKASVGDLFATLNVDRVTTASVARDAYIDASRLNPSSPRIEFAIGRAELLLENREGAMLHLNKAVELRPAYPEAIAALAELNRQGGNMDKAIEIATAGLQSDPSNFVISFQLGFLYYTKGDYDRAIAAFENALASNPYYADAKYFLGISYARKGNAEAALRQFEGVRELNPGNTEIVRVIGNLKAGRDPLQD